MDIEGQTPRPNLDDSDRSAPSSPTCSAATMRGGLAVVVAMLTGYGQCAADGSRLDQSARGTSTGS